MDNKIDYLVRLELPFFIGVVSQSPPTMMIYSAEFLPLLFSEVGKPEKLSLVPVHAADFDLNTYYELGANKDFKLRCPLVAVLNVDDDRASLKAMVKSLLEICARAHSNIATRLQEEHIYDVDGKGQYRIMAGPGSVRFFRSNFLKRLGEAFYNLEWISRNSPPTEAFASEFRIFESLFLDLEKLYAGAPLPDYVSRPYVALKAKLGG